MNLPFQRMTLFEFYSKKAAGTNMKSPVLQTEVKCGGLFIPSLTRNLILLTEVFYLFFKLWFDK